MNKFDAFIDQHHHTFIAELKTFCAQPSIAATGEGIAEMAHLVQDSLAELGATTQRLEVAPNAPPVVYATLGAGDKTLLIYNHYDVQPADPFDLWDSPPFAPQVREGKIFGRGVSDNKGHLLQRIQAIRAWQETIGGLPCKINWFIEGEEEIGSPHLEAFCSAHPELLQADGCLWEMGNVDSVGQPVLTAGAKGLLYVELRVRSSHSDQHSAMGTLVPNAAWRLVWALNTLKAPDETILVEGLLDYVVPPSPADLTLLEKIPFPETAMLESFGIRHWVGGLSGLDALRQHLFQPTCTICGIESGYTGVGPKTVLPAIAKAKVGFRLVPNLTPALVVDLLRKHLDRHGFSDIEVVVLGGQKPGKSDTTAPIVQAALTAARDTYPAHEPVLYPLTPGTGPVWPVAVAQGTPLVSFGSSYDGAQLHAPNENLRLIDYFDGIRMMGRFIEAFGQI